MAEIRHALALLNECSGLFLFFILVAVLTCAEKLSAMEKHFECFHEDYEKVTSAHDIPEKSEIPV